MSNSNSHSEKTRIVFYDGVCALCNHTVKFLLKIDRKHILRYAPLQGETAEEYDLSIEKDAPPSNIIFVIEHNRKQQVFHKSTAVLEIFSEIGGAWQIVAWLRIIPRPVRDFVYDFIARYRYKWFGKYDSCPLPPPEVRKQFLP